MKREIFFLIPLGLLLLLACPSGFILSQSTGLHGYDSNGGTTTGGSGADLGTIMGNIEKAVALIFSAVAVICFVLAAIMFLTAEGSPEKIKTARSAFFWGIAGIVVGIMAFTIIAIVASALQGSF
jgi:hypothetical protein